MLRYGRGGAPLSQNPPPPSSWASALWAWLLGGGCDARSPGIDGTLSSNANNPLVFESLSVNEVFEPGETWTFPWQAQHNESSLKVGVLA